MYYLRALTFEQVYYPEHNMFTNVKMETQLHAWQAPDF
jgi:hypothetical protein